MILGIIGGLGPAATIYFMDLITQMTDATCDQEHLEMLVHSMPSIPDRTAYLLGKSPRSPLPEMISVGQKLVCSGADVIAIPCMTAHAFHDDLQKQIDAPILNGIRLTAQALKEAGVSKAGIMATDGTIQTQLFQVELEICGITPVIPSDEGQKRVMSLIYDDIKTSKEADINKFNRVKYELFDKGAQCIILGCTELSLLKRDFDIGKGFADAMEILAYHSITKCNKTSRRELSQLADRI